MDGLNRECNGLAFKRGMTENITKRTYAFLVGKPMHVSTWSETPYTWYPLPMLTSRAAMSFHPQLAVEKKTSHSDRWSLRLIKGTQHQEGSNRSNQNQESLFVGIPWYQPALSITSNKPFVSFCCWSLIMSLELVRVGSFCSLRVAYMQNYFVHKLLLLP